MELKLLIDKLQYLQQIHGDNIKVMLDDLYTPASREIDDIFAEPQNGDASKAIVLVIRD